MGPPRVMGVVGKSGGAKTYPQINNNNLYNYVASLI